MNGESINIYGRSFRKNIASEKIASIFYDLRSKGYSSIPPFIVGSLGKDVIAFAKKKGIILGSEEMYFSVKSITHAMRATKGDKRVPEKDMIEFPVRKRNMNKYFDGESFIYTDYKVKFVVRPNYTLKLPNGKSKVANFITAGLVTDIKEFKLPKYEKI